MPRRNNNKNNNNNHRGRGRGRGRGWGGPNGVPTTVAPATASASRTPRHPYPNLNAEFDVAIQQWEEPPIVTYANGGGNVNRGGRPWRGGTPRSGSGAGTPSRGRGGPRRGDLTPRGNGAGRGRGGRGRGRGRGRELDNGGDPFSARRRPHFGSNARAIIGKDAPLSDLLYSTRPLLRPVKFVRATLTPFLFQESEEMLNPASTSQAADTTETSHVPTADRVAQLFHDIALNSDSESQGRAQDALEEIDFADLAQIRAEVEAIAQDTATMNLDDHDDQKDIEEVDFADLAAMRAKVGAADPQAASRDDIIQEVFTGVYNQIEDTMQVSSTMDVVGDDQPHGVQQTASLSVSHVLDDLLDPKPSIEISNPSHYESFSHARDTIVVEEEVPRSSSASPNVSVEEPSLSTAPETHLASVPTDDTPLHPAAPPHDDSHPLFVVDTAPTRALPGRSASDIILVDRTGHGETLGDQDEEFIVYVAPHPRSGHASPVPAIPRVKLPRTSMLTGRSLETDGLRSPVRKDDGDPMPASDRDRTSTTRAGLEGEAGEDFQLSLASLTLGPTISTTTSASSPPHASSTKAARRARKKEVRLQRQNKQSLIGFGAYGAMVSEARLRDEDVRERRGPRWEMRRRGDSDVDWGTGDEDEDEDEDGEGKEGVDGVDAMSDGLGGMEIDPDLVMDVDAMQGFVKSMSAEGSRFVTINDIEDEARMQQEDEEGEGGPEGSSDSERSDEEDEEDEEEEEEVFNIEEEILIAESEGDEELSEDSDDDELSPRSSFQARLRKVRERSRGQHPKTAGEISDDEDNEDMQPLTRSAGNEDLIAHINDLIEENSQILAGRNRKEKKAVFRNLHQGRVDKQNVEVYLDDPEFTTPVNKKKGKKGKGKQFTGDFSPELEAQWVKDRAKKAEYKRQRQTARFLAALNADANAGNNERARTSHKATSSAARLDPSEVLFIAPGMIVDMDSLEAQMRRFVEDVGERRSMAFPPMHKEMRKSVHEMARLFGLKSASEGNGAGRYTRLFKTSWTGVEVSEKKLSKLVRRYGGGKSGRGQGRGQGTVPRHREGDEVGKEAPKIGERNIGFRMLASMGWSEGDRIGGTASVGIEAPLTAIIKNSKLGLGATL